MRVLNVMSRFNVGGTSQWLFQLSFGLNANGIDNLLVIGNCPKHEREDERISRISHQRLPGLGASTNMLTTLRSFIELRKIIKNYNPDIVNTHTSKAGVLGRIACKTVRTRAVTVHTYHGHVLSGYFSKPIELTIKFIERMLSYITDFFFVSGELVSSDLRRAGIIRSDNFINVWPGVPEYKIENRSKFRKKLDIPADQLVVGWLGRKVPIKRIDRILEAAAELPEILFLVAGDGESVRQSFPNYFSSDNLKNVIELGYSTPSEVWSISDIAILTSDNEAMPISPIEAALASVPIIAIDSGATREVMINGITGILCPKDSSSITAAIKSLAQDQVLRHKMGEAARKYAISKFSPQGSVLRQLEGFQAALETKRH